MLHHRKKVVREIFSDVRFRERKPVSYLEVRDPTRVLPSPMQYGFDRKVSKLVVRNDMRAQVAQTSGARDRVVFKYAQQNLVEYRQNLVEYRRTPISKKKAAPACLETSPNVRPRKRRDNPIEQKRLLNDLLSATADLLDVLAFKYGAHPR